MTPEIREDEDTLYITQMNTNTHVAPLFAVHWGEEEGAGQGVLEICSV
jgi:hypothetical protein